MSADSAGNDLDAVGIPISGLAAIAPVLAENVIEKADLSASPVVLPAAYKRLGLFKVDGGPQNARETGDAIEFFQIGYKQAGDGTRSVTINLAEFNDAVQMLIEGVEPDADGVIEASSRFSGMTWNAEPMVTSAARMGVPSGSRTRRMPCSHIVWRSSSCGSAAGARSRKRKIAGSGHAAMAPKSVLRMSLRRPKPDSLLASSKILTTFARTSSEPRVS